MNIKYRGYPKGTCRHCGVTEDQDYMTLQDFGNHDIDFSHPADSDRCVITYTDGTHGAIDADGILRDVDPVNVLLQQDDRVSVAFNDFAAHTAAMFLLLLMGAMLAMSLATPDHVSGKVSDDAPVMEAK